MVRPAWSLPYVVDPSDPRAPPTELWNAMTPEERQRVVDTLPSEFPMEAFPPPEGDRHLIPKLSAKDALGRHFQRIGRRAYVSNEVPIYYPNERMFSADVVVVLDVDPHPRDSWVVDKEGKGLDFAMEIHVRGDFRKDMQRNVEKYARLGIPEYFVFDRPRGDLFGFRLAGARRAYERIVPQHGRFASLQLGMDLMVEASKVRFLVGDAALPDADELIGRLGAALDEVIANKLDAEQRAEALEQALAEEQKRREEEQQRREEEQQRREEEQQRREEEQKRREEEQQRREEAERALAEARAEIERLRRG